MKAACAVIVMAKAPVPGYAKTRLIPALGAAGAARLAARLLDHAMAQALSADLGVVNLCCAPNAREPAFAMWQAQAGGVQLTTQSPGDLGQRMSEAFARRLEQGGDALMIGTDAPALNAPMLQRAAAALHSADVVLVPALDGGYALIGLRRPLPELFADMPWSTSSLLHATRARLRDLGLCHTELPPVADIDEPADLQHLPSGWLV